MYFSKFNNAANDMIETYKKNINNSNNVVRSNSEICFRLAYCISNGHRFYVPDSSNIISEKTVNPEIKFYMRLPFDCVVLLSETFLNDDIELERNSESVDSWKISIAIDIHGETNNYLKLFPKNKAVVGDYAIVSIVFIPDENLWVFTYACAVSYHPLDSFGYKKYAFCGNEYLDHMNSEFSIDHMIKEMDSDIGSIQNLCLMLGLNNVNIRTVEPDVKLNKSRLLKGKQPLYSYSVLNVDNVLWDRHLSNCSSRTFNGRRTHFRRGHIRRLANGNRVWVKAALVSGSNAGFVDKEYHVSSNGDY